MRGGGAKVYSCSGGGWGVQSISPWFTKCNLYWKWLVQFSCVENSGLTQQAPKQKWHTKLPKIYNLKCSRKQSKWYKTKGIKLINLWVFSFPCFAMWHRLGWCLRWVVRCSSQCRLHCSSRFQFSVSRKYKINWMKLDISTHECTASYNQITRLKWKTNSLLEPIPSNTHLQVRWLHRSLMRQGL